ncbi:hypothetical protein P167DRAFT_540750 [Morchella conica CCBAS932]|uniref:RAB6-interacting golgin n=1 Tax=Morchella conica CCBAS932 TaxID=1392247 RepID=A0A3N4K7J9_9PEZI|nr:hypothetical protein P167DRAFT_540750 [Morchella conica CCBAS932]
MSFKEEAERLQADTEGRKTEKERKLPEIKTVGRKDLTGSARVMRRLPFQEGGGLVAEAEPKKLKTEIAGGKDSADPTLEAQRICFKKQGEGLKADMERMKVDAENLNNEVKKVAQVWERERMGIATLFAEFNAREKARDEKLKAGLDRLLDEMEQLRSGTHRKLKQNDPKIVEGVRAEAEKVGQERW